MLRAEKDNLVENTKILYKDYSNFIVAEYQGLKVSDFTSLRKSLREHGGGFQVIKNTLSKRAAGNSPITNMFKGPIGLAYSNDIVAVSKTMVQFSKANTKLKIIGGLVDQDIYNTSQIVELSKLLSIEEIRGKILGSISGVASKVIGIVQAPSLKVARIVSTYASKCDS